MNIRTQNASKFHVNKLWHIGHIEDELWGAWKFITFHTFLQILYGRVNHACDELQNS